MVKRGIEFSFYVLTAIATIMLVLNITDLFNNQNKADFLQSVSIIVLLVFLIAVLLLIYFFRESFVRGFVKDRISGLVEKKVYTSSGDYVGHVEDIYIQENKIYGVKIKLDGKKSKKKILLRSGAIINYGEVVLIDPHYAEKLEEQSK